MNILVDLAEMRVLVIIVKHLLTGGEFELPINTFIPKASKMKMLGDLALNVM
jgi:hypothetical protein